MKHWWATWIILIIGLLVIFSACGGSEDVAQSSSSAVLDPSKTADSISSSVGARLYVFHAGTNNVTVIDTANNEVVLESSVPGISTWAWTDDTNYYDGENLWVANMDPDTEQAEVALLNLDTLEVSAKIPLGQERGEAFISKISTDGLVFVSLLSQGEVVVIDAAQLKVVDRLSANKIACDVDIVVLSDGSEFAYIPNREADTIQIVDAKTSQIISTIDQPEGSAPWMLAVAPDGLHVWVQDQKSNTNSILDTKTLEAVKRMPTGNVPSMVAFSPDGTEAYTGHAKDAIVIVSDVQTYEELERIYIGQNPLFVIFSPDGKHAYATVMRENSVAVIDTATRKIVKRIEVRRSPAGVYMLPR